MNEMEFRGRIRIEVTVLDLWIDRGWLSPERSGDQRTFRDVDVARAELIRDLTDQMGVNDAGVDIVMDLLDQVHGLRRTLNEIRGALRQQDEVIQHRILRAMQGTGR